MSDNENLFGSDVESTSGSDAESVGKAFRAGNTSESDNESFDNEEKESQEPQSDEENEGVQTPVQEMTQEEEVEEDFNEEIQRSPVDSEISDDFALKVEEDDDSNQMKIDTPKDDETQNFNKIDSDEDEDEISGVKEKEVGNLFGDADDISSDEEKAAAGRSHSNDFGFLSSEEETGNDENLLALQDDDQEDEERGDLENNQETTRIQVEIPKITTDLGSKIHFVRFPNFLSVESRPFDPSVYEDEIEEDELMDEEGRTRLKLKVENTIRWKKFTDENGIELTESNAKFVRWSDNSMTLHLGSEVFDVYQMSLQGDHNHLFIRQGTGLQGQAVFKTKLSFRPNSTKSATHKKMTSRLAMRHSQNQQKVRVLPVAGKDPESRKVEMMKKEEEELKAHMRREAQARRVRERAHARGLSHNYLDEAYDEEDGVSVQAIKNRMKSSVRRHEMESSDSGSDYDLKNVGGKLQSSDDDEDNEGVGIDSKRRKLEEGKEARKKAYIVSDDEDSDEEAANEASPVASSSANQQISTSTDTDDSD